MDSSTKTTFVASALAMLKYRLDRMPDDTTRDTYYTARIEQAIETLERRKIALADTTEDLMLVTDLAAWYNANRDQSGAMPRWLWDRIKGRWINNDT